LTISREKWLGPSQGLLEVLGREGGVPIQTVYGSKQAGIGFSNGTTMA
jgi:hypothetical protein